MEIDELLKKVTQILEELKIEYCVSGGFAVTVWGRVRTTLDLDIVIQLEAKKISIFIKKILSLSKAGYLDEASVKEMTAKGGEFNFIHPESGLKVDFWAIKKGDKNGQRELKRRKAKKMFGQKIYFVSPEDLILNKLRWYMEAPSDKQSEDIKSILKLSKVDLKYLKKEALTQKTAEILSLF